MILPSYRLIRGHNSIELEKQLRAYCAHKPFSEKEDPGISAWFKRETEREREIQRRKIQ